jgi:rare lipoprotein A
MYKKIIGIFILLLLLNSFFSERSSSHSKKIKEHKQIVELISPIIIEDTAFTDELMNNDSNNISGKLLLASRVAGKSSHYSAKFHNRKTASGELFDMFDWTAAHKKLPFGTIVRVINQKNGKAVLVRINDRGPFARGRIIDLSYRSAKEIDGFGTPSVIIEYFNQDEIIENIDTNYLLGYSFNNPLIIIKKEYIVKVRETGDFEFAMNEYNFIEASNAGHHYIFVNAGKTLKKANYIIGYVNSKSIAEQLQNY